jgi:hypothetical protein
VYDLIIVPGGGLRPDGTLPSWVRNRFDRALEIRRTEPILCLSAGTVHKAPPLDDNGRPIFEASVGAGYLLARRLDATSILTETASWDTIGNAFFARAMHTDPRGWHRLLVVNSAFHMARARAIFEWVFSLSPDLGYSLAFETVPDVGAPDADFACRRERERASLERVQELRRQIRTMAGLHEFVFFKHGAYSVEGLINGPEAVPEQLMHLY